MQKRSLNLIACLLFYVSSLTAQVNDSVWFDDYFTRLTNKRQFDDPTVYDSLWIVKGLAEKKNYLPAICRYYIETAGLFVSSKKTDSAISYFNKAIDLAEKNKIIREAGSAYLGLANLHQFNGKTLDAAENYLKAVRLLKDERRKRTLIGLYRNLYNINNRLQQKNSALQNMLSAIGTNKSNENDLVKIINTRNSEDEGFYFPDQSLVKEVGADIIYVIFGGAKFVVRDFKTMASYGASRDVQRIPVGSLSFIPDFPRNGAILMEFQGGDPKVYLVRDSMLYHVYNTDVLENYGGWDAVYFVPINSLSGFPKATEIVTQENVNSIFNLNQEFDDLSNSISKELKRNTSLSNELSQKLAARNNALQKRNLWLWISAVGFVSLLVIVFLVIRNFIQKQKLHRQTMEALKAEEELQRKMVIEKERTRIATDMHDDLGAGLSRIKFLSETIGLKKKQQLSFEEEIDNIRDYSNEMIGKMGEIVWALNEKNDSLNDLLSYTRSYAVEYLLNNGIRCTVKTPDQIPELSVSGEFRRNIYLSVKEALHNVVKHATARHVIITIKIEKNLIISISDDGIGYTRSENLYGNGLLNMEQRMKNINGRFEMENKNGTTIWLMVPVAT